MLKINKKVMVHAYKRNGWLYRIWEFPRVVEINDEFICLSMKGIKIITSKEDSTRNFHSKHPKDSYWFFFKDKWFNIIAHIDNKDVVQYYINIASPFIYEDEAIKYYDLDFDIKMRSNFALYYKKLDEKEFIENKVKFKYENKLIKKAENTFKLFEDIEFRKKIIEKINFDLLNKYITKGNKSND